MPRALSHLQAVGIALTGYTLWVFADTSFKYVGISRIPATQVIAVVGLTTVLIMLGYSLWQRSLRTLWPQRPARQFIRALLEVGNNLCVVIALRHLPLAMFYILVFLSPSVTTLAAAALLGERLNLRQALAILAGFCGVVIAVGPMGSRVGSPLGYAACFICVACFSANLVWSRIITQSETPASLTFFSGLVLALTGTVATLLTHAEPVTFPLGLAMAAAAIFGMLGSLCFFLALRNTTAANVAQYHYTQLFTGSLLAWWLFHERLTPWMLAGATLIIVAGVYTATLAHSLTPPQPAPASES